MKRIVRMEAGAGANNNCSSSSENTPRPRANRDTNEQGNLGHSLRGKHRFIVYPFCFSSLIVYHFLRESLVFYVSVLPDFAQVYSFIGSVFDPHASNHLQKLKKMDPIDVETVGILDFFSFF